MKILFFSRIFFRKKGRCVWRLQFKNYYHIPQGQWVKEENFSRYQWFMALWIMYIDFVCCCGLCWFMWQTINSSSHPWKIAPWRQPCTLQSMSADVFVVHSHQLGVWFYPTIYWWNCAISEHFHKKWYLCINLILPHMFCSDYIILVTVLFDMLLADPCLLW